MTSVAVLLTLPALLAVVSADVSSPYRYPTDCEICKILAIELTNRFETSGRYRTKIELGHGLDRREKKSIDYLRSELRYEEAVHDPHVCNEVIKYNVHAERDGSNRYAKGISETFSTIKGLVNKGVQVELGFPHNFLDQPDAEVTIMQKKCYQLVEQNDDLLEQWYWGDQKEPLASHLCHSYLKARGQSVECLTEVWKGKKGQQEGIEGGPRGPPEDSVAAQAAAQMAQAAESQKSEL